MSPSSKRASEVYIHRMKHANTWTSILLASRYIHLHTHIWMHVQAMGSEEETADAEMRFLFLPSPLNEGSKPYKL